MIENDCIVTQVGLYDEIFHLIPLLSSQYSYRKALKVCQESPQMLILLPSSISCTPDQLTHLSRLSFKVSYPELVFVFD